MVEEPYRSSHKDLLTVAKLVHPSELSLAVELHSYHCHSSKSSVHNLLATNLYCVQTPFHSNTPCVYPSHPWSKIHIH